MKKLFALILVLTLALSLAACANSKLKTKEAELKSDSEQSTESTIESTEPPAEKCVISELRPFSEGLAWVKYTQSDGTVKTGAINAKGELVFSLDNNPTYCSPFTDGVAFCLTNKTFAIYDKTGTKLYSSSGGDNAYILLGYGDGHFLVAKHVQNIDTNEWRLGTIDKNGAVINEMKVYEGTGYGRNVVENIVNGIALGGRGIYSTSEGVKPAEYLGEGFMSMGRYSQHLYSIKANSVYDCGTITGKFTDGMMIMTGSGYCAFISPTYAGEEVKATSHSFSMGSDTKELCEWKPEQGPCPTNNWYNEGLVFGGIHKGNNVYEYGYFDSSLNMKISFSDLVGKDFRGSPFVGGYAILKITGADKKTYITAIDKNGTKQYTPLAVDSVNIFESGNGYVWAKINGKEVIVDLQGKAKTPGVDDLSGIGDASFRDVSEGFYIFTDKYVSLDGKTVIDSAQEKK